ncbi:cytochrome C assembly family protein [Methylomagnum sp.]
MYSTLFGSLAPLAYLTATGVIFHSLKSNRSPTAGPHRLTALTFGWIAAASHALAIVSLYSAKNGLDFSFLGALSLVSLITVLIVLAATLFKPMDKLGLVVFPLAAVMLLLNLLLPEAARPIRNHSWPMTAHILSSVLAYGFLNIAAIQAVLLALQDWRLRSRHTGGLLVRSLPPLQTMESLLFQLIGAGFVLLTASLVTGFLFLENMFAQHLAHKTVLSILAWIVFAVLLVGRIRHGWRGQIAIRWTLGGFVSLMLAYFGSKMVLEWILNRA